jgi:hypothetical protein
MPQAAEDSGYRLRSLSAGPAHGFRQSDLELGFALSAGIVEGCAHDLFLNSLSG